jgi:hypothetical protein
VTAVRQVAVIPDESAVTPPFPESIGAQEPAFLPRGWASRPAESDGRARSRGVCRSSSDIPTREFARSSSAGMPDLAQEGLPWLS